MRCRAFVAIAICVGLSACSESDSGTSHDATTVSTASASTSTSPADSTTIPSSATESEPESEPETEPEPEPEPTVTTPDDPVLAYIALREAAGEGSLEPCRRRATGDCVVLDVCQDGSAVVRDEHDAGQSVRFAFLAQDDLGWQITDIWDRILGVQPPEWVSDAAEGGGNRCTPRW